MNVKAPPLSARPGENVRWIGIARGAFGEVPRSTAVSKRVRAAPDTVIVSGRFWLVVPVHSPSKGDGGATSGSSSSESCL